MVKQVIIVNREHPLAAKDEIDLAELDKRPHGLPGHIQHAEDRAREEV